jgi:hypothetical protein
MSLFRSDIERKANRYTYRKDSHVDKNPSFRLAGRIFQESDVRTEKRKEERSSLQRSRPVGYGFANKDEYGPDNDWDSKDSLRRIHDRDHYIVGGNLGLSAPSY